MPLAVTVDSLDAVPEGIRDSYVAKDGKFHLTVDGLVSKDRLDEFRNNNIAFKRENDELKTRYADVDLTKYKELTAQEAKLRDKTLLDAGKVDELFAERTSVMKTEHDKLLKAAERERDGAKKQLDSLLVDGALRDEAAKAGVRPAAIDDVLLRGRQVFRVHDGKATAFDGDKAVYGKDGEALSMAGWVGGLVERAPHLFEASSGGGSDRSNPGRASGGKVMTRAEFERVPHMQRAAIMKAGTTLVD